MDGATLLSCAAALMLGLALPGGALAQTPDSTARARRLKQLSIEELMRIEVTSVSRRPEPLSSTASAIQIITGDDIRRSGATSVPEALRLATNLQVAQVNASQWAVSARGFNNVLANKLLVLIDGRTVYTPLYAGVFWDVQNVPLETVDRIEVVSGPGGTLWGANAVNGIINIITKNAAETPGLALSVAAGNELEAAGELRYGGRFGSSGPSWRVHGLGFSRSSTVGTDGADPGDDWGLGQGGFRMDWSGGKGDGFTVQGDYYEGRPDPDGNAEIVARGANALGRWSRPLTERSDFQLQVYWDRTHRDFGNGFVEDLSTYDADWQHRFPLGDRHEIIWGLGYRLMDHRTRNLPLFAFEPGHKLLHLFSGFVQDEIVLGRGLRATVGTKIEHTTYTGVEIQPSGRLAWEPAQGHVLWGAASRAVRTPSRIDRDFFLYALPGVPIIAGSEFESEDVLAFELGWRAQPAAGLSLSLAGFYNDYDGVRSSEPGPPPFGIPITFGNGVQGQTWGAELKATVQAAPGWRLRGGYTYLEKDLSLAPGSADLNGATAESNDPEHQFLVHSSTDLPGGLALDAVVRLVDALPRPRVAGYGELDLRLGWRPMPRLELSVVGQNLLHGDHAEFVPASPSPRRLERSIYGRVSWR